MMKLSSRRESIGLTAPEGRFGLRRSSVISPTAKIGLVFAGFGTS